LRAARNYRWLVPGNQKSINNDFDEKSMKRDATRRDEVYFTNGPAVSFDIPSISQEPGRRVIPIVLTVFPVRARAPSSFLFLLRERERKRKEKKRRKGYYDGPALSIKILRLYPAELVTATE